MGELDNLWAARYRLVVTPRDPLVLPVLRRGLALRGAFGLAYRRLVCHDLDLACRDCALVSSCPYPEVFEPTPAPGSERLSKLSDLPRPFVLSFPETQAPLFAPGEPLTLGLCIAGRASRLLPYFVVALRALADEGIGPSRARLRIDEISALDRNASTLEVYRSPDQSVRPSAPAVRAPDLLQPGDAMRTALVLRFVTPTELKDDGKPVLSPHLGPLVRRLRDRLNALSCFFADGPLDLDFKHVGALADTVELVTDRTTHVSVPRRSRSTGQRHDIGGFLGQADYRGDAIGELMPLLRMGELLHVGKHAAFGNGRYVIG